MRERQIYIDEKNLNTRALIEYKKRAANISKYSKVNLGAAGKIIQYAKQKGLSRHSEAETLKYSEYWLDSLSNKDTHETNLNIQADERAEQQRKINNSTNRGR